MPEQSISVSDKPLPRVGHRPKRNLAWVWLIPIVAALGCAAFVKFQYTENAKQNEALRKEHREEVAKMTEALNNNTLALQKLLDKIGE